MRRPYWASGQTIGDPTGSGGSTDPDMTIWGYDRINSLSELGPVYMLYSVVPTQIVHTGGRRHPPYGVIYFL